MNLFSFFVILLGFGVFVFVFQKFQNKTMSQISANTTISNPFEKLAEELGLTYETFTPNQNKNVLYSSGLKMSGTYQGIPLEMMYAMSTQTESALSRFQASYTMQKTLALTVSNSKNISFQIMPKSLGATGGTPTGNEKFDNTLLLMGNIPLPQTFLEYCADLGWMNLSLQGNTLLFNDTFYDEMKGLSGSMNMMTARHPIWKSTATQTNIDFESAKTFFDQIATLAKTLS
jgi:hypothetical protein